MTFDQPQSDQPQSDQPQPDLHQIKAAAQEAFGQLPGIVGFGLGERSLRIYVNSDTLCQQLPPEFQGVSVDCVVSGEISTSW